MGPESCIDFMLDVFGKNQETAALIWKDRTYSYGWLSSRIQHWQNTLAKQKIGPGTTVLLEADFSPNAIALFIALTKGKCILVPLTYLPKDKRREFLRIAQPMASFRIDNRDKTSFIRFSNSSDHPLYARLRREERPGLVLFSSGSTGKPKAAVHDLEALLSKFRIPRRRLRTIAFLLYDHLGGFDTMFCALSSASCIITLQDRSPDTVLEAVEKYRAELLPTSPTFLNLVILSGAHKRHDLSSLKVIAYGTEPMPKSTLKQLSNLLPHVDLRQTYGLSELGTLRVKSKGSGSLWIKVGGGETKTRIVNGELQVKTPSAMLGYLNAESPFTKDGWFITGDEVEIEGDYIRILGRKSEIINVGGQKVFPAEVENVIQEMAGVADVTVFGEANPLLGNIVCADVTLSTKYEPSTFRSALKKYCQARLEPYKVPLKINILKKLQHSERFKKLRRPKSSVK